MTALKLIQLAGVLVLLLGVVMAVGRSDSFAPVILAGGLMYAAGRIAVWLKAKS
jgi:hypothetical protein